MLDSLVTDRFATIVLTSTVMPTSTLKLAARRLTCNGWQAVMLVASAMSQHATLDDEPEMQLKMTNVGIGAGYGYNFVPSRGWLLHISSLPTFILYSKASMSVGDERMSLRYHFPEVIITGRGAAVYQWGNKFMGLSMVYNYTNIGDENDFAVYNTKWRLRAFFGLRF